MEARRSSLPELNKPYKRESIVLKGMALVHYIVFPLMRSYIGIRSIYDELCRLLRFVMTSDKTNRLPIPIVEKIY